MSYSKPIVPVFSYSRCFRNLSMARYAGGGRSGIPPPSRTGITLTSTRSTRPAASKLRKSSPPPKRAMSLPGERRSHLASEVRNWTPPNDAFAVSCFVVDRGAES